MTYPDPQTDLKPHLGPHPPADQAAASQSKEQQPAAFQPPQAQFALQPQIADEWMMAAHLLRPQGRRGELLADPAAPFEIFTPGKRFATGAAPEKPAEPITLVDLESAWQPTGRNAGRLVLKLGGTDTITAAEAMAGRHLFVRVRDLPALKDGTYRVRDLTGCTLFDRNVPVGTVLDLQFAVGPDGRTRLEDAPDLLVVQPLASPELTSSERTTSEPANPKFVDLDAEPVLIPFVRAWLLEVDLPARRLRMALPPGLFDAEDSSEDQAEQ